jgi:hypothetical protein
MGWRTGDTKRHSHTRWRHRTYPGGVEMSDCVPCSIHYLSWREHPYLYRSPSRDASTLPLDGWLLGVPSTVHHCVDRSHQNLLDPSILLGNMSSYICSVPSSVVGFVLQSIFSTHITYYKKLPHKTSDLIFRVEGVCHFLRSPRVIQAPIVMWKWGEVCFARLAPGTQTALVPRSSKQYIPYLGSPLITAASIGHCVQMITW